MSPRRRPRGTLVEPIPVGYQIERASKERLDAIAKNANISTAYLIELLVEHVELNDQGVPVWLPERPRDEELPITST